MEGVAAEGSTRFGNLKKCGDTVGTHLVRAQVEAVSTVLAAGQAVGEQGSLGPTGVVTVASW